MTRPNHFITVTTEGACLAVDQSLNHAREFVAGWSSTDASPAEIVEVPADALSLDRRGVLRRRAEIIARHPVNA